MTAGRTLGSVVGVMLIGAAMGFDVLKVYGGGPQNAAYDPFCFGGTGAQCYTDPPPRNPTKDTQDTCTGKGKVWGLPTGDPKACADAGGTFGDAASIAGYGSMWTPYFMTLGTLSALLAVAIIMYYLIYFRPYTSQLKIVGIISFLVGGVILEYFLMSQYHDTYNGPVSSATYFVIAVNTLARLWVLLDVGCFEAQTSIPGVINQELQKAVSKGVAIGAETVKNAGKEMENVDFAKLFTDRLWGQGVKRALQNAGITDEQKLRDIRSAVGVELGAKPATGGRKRR